MDQPPRWACRANLLCYGALVESSRMHVGSRGKARGWNVEDATVEDFLWVLLSFVPFGICVLLAWKQKGSRRPDGTNLG